jgi:phosphatidylglycerophosphate synthase
MKELRRNLMLLSLFLILSIVVVNAMGRIGEILLTYLIVTLSIFISITYLIITSILNKNNIPIESWTLFSMVVIFIGASEFFGVFMNNKPIAEQFLAVSMILLFIAALMKFWSTVNITKEKKKVIKQKKKK